MNLNRPMHKAASASTARRPMRAGKWHAAALAAMGCAALPGQATVLEFDQIRVGGNVVPTISGNGPEPDYGDKVTGSPMNVSGGQFTYGHAGEGFTPNIVADFFAGSATDLLRPRVTLWHDSYGDLVNVLIGNNSSLSLNVRLTADPGFTVQLHHFDLAGWVNTDYAIAAVRVFDGAGELLSQSGVDIEGDFSGPRHTSFDFAAPLSAAVLQIQVDYGNLPGGQQDNIGIDNIRFGQNPPPAVPWPATSVLLLAGLGLVVRRVRRLRLRCPARCAPARGRSPSSPGR